MVNKSICPNGKNTLKGCQAGGDFFDL